MVRDIAPPERVNDDLVPALRQISAYDPAHLPAGIDLVERLRKRLPDIPQVACFDTAFHRDLPRVAASTHPPGAVRLIHVKADAARSAHAQSPLTRRNEGKTTMKTVTQLQPDVIAELKWEPSVNAAQIGVEVKDGIVTLAGHVRTHEEKWNAERAANAYRE